MKTCIFGLIKGFTNYNDYSLVRTRNKLIKENVLPYNKSDLIIFHEGNILYEHQQLMSNEIGIKINFIDISDKCFKNPSTPVDNTLMGYKHMCRFNSIQVYDYLSGYDYAMRLDDDSFIETIINYNIFQVIKDNNIVYGGIRNHIDAHDITQKTLPPFVKEYLEEKNINPLCGFDKINSQNFYNNFYVTDLKFWKNPEVVDFLNYIDKSNNIYHYRWGDSTIQALAVKIFAGMDKINIFKNFKYTHKSHNWSNNPNNTVLNIPL